MVESHFGPEDLSLFGFVGFEAADEVAVAFEFGHEKFHLFFDFGGKELISFLCFSAEEFEHEFAFGRTHCFQDED